MGVIEYTYDGSFPEAIKAGVDDLYDAADKKERCDDWVVAFSKDATVWKNESPATGHEAIKKYIIGTWNNTESRIHYVKSVTAVSQNPLKLSISGITTYVRSDGRNEKGEWTAEQSYVEEDGEPKISEYKIKFAFVPI
ncbi:hypothetical protein GQ53DRAFT_821122 [Thozetella sp. PMI_491]|nr:hypothetical protein GQ53DRAFT_821122 [Thozetella sp. PMI_491]